MKHEVLHMGGRKVRVVEYEDEGKFSGIFVEDEEALRRKLQSENSALKPDEFEKFYNDYPHKPVVMVKRSETDEDKGYIKKIVNRATN